MAHRFDPQRSAALVAAARADRQMTQAQLARAARMSQPNIAAIEAGRRAVGPDALERLLSAADYRPSLPLEETAAAIDDAIAQWHSEFPERLEFAIISEAGHIGGITLYYLEDRTNGELGWVMHRDHWGRGYITEAALALMDYAAKDLGIRRMIACCDSENIASRRVMEKLGMKYCSTGKRKNRSSGEEERIELIYEISL